jgi:hypothetical protein
MIVVWRQSDGSAYWKDITEGVKGLSFDKKADVFDAQRRPARCAHDRPPHSRRLPAASQSWRAGHHLLRVKLPNEIFVAKSPFGSGRDTIPELEKQDDTRFDWVIRKRRFISFFDPRECGTRAIVDLDQVEAVDTELLALSDDPDDITDIVDLLRRTTTRQTASELSYLRKERLFYFGATGENRSRSYKYAANVKEPSARLVSYYPNKKDLKRPGYVRRHAATFRFERLADESFVVTDRTFYFTRNGYQPHPYPRCCSRATSGSRRMPPFAAR